MCELKGRMPYAEFIEHIAYHQECAWGDDWQQTAALSASVSNASPKFRRIDLTKYFPKSRSQNRSSVAGMFEAFREIAVSRGK